MSNKNKDDGIEIRHGGAIIVDTEVLRGVGVRLASVAGLVDDGVADLDRANRCIVETAGLTASVDTVALWASRDSLADLSDRMTQAATGVGLMADAYELVELRAKHRMLDVDGATMADTIRGEIAALESKDERISIMADYLIADAEGRRYEGLDGQFDTLTALGIFPGAVITTVTLLGNSKRLGTVSPGIDRRVTNDQVEVRPVDTSAPLSAPSSLADSLRRFPEDNGAQIKVEKYTFADGTSRFVVYIVGTQSGWLGGKNPWDMRSNLELYSGDLSASYQATVDALHAAGAGPDDTVDIYAHSQGGMVASYLATSGEFKTEVVVTAGSPTEPVVNDDQLLIQLRHSDDLVNGLAGGGDLAGYGSSDSFTVTREGDPFDGPQDLILRPHFMDKYEETAEMVDKSDDPRVDVYREYLARMSGAVTIETTEFKAERVD